MKLSYSLPTTFSAEGITIGGTVDGITDVPEGTKEERAALKAFLAHPSVKHRVAAGVIRKITAEDAPVAEEITLEDDDDSDASDETDADETEADEEEVVVATPRGRRSTRKG